MVATVATVKLTAALVRIESQVFALNIFRNAKCIPIEKLC